MGRNLFFIMTLEHDQDIINKLREGDRTTFNLIYSRYYLRMFYFAREYVVSESDAEDIVQNVFIKLWNYRSSLHENTKIEAWLYKVTRNESLSMLDHLKVVNRYRSRIEKSILDINQRALKSLELPEDTTFDIRNIIEEAIESLPPRSKKVFEYSRSMSYKEIAQAMSISVKTVESHMTKALSVLRRALKDYLAIFFTML